MITEAQTPDDEREDDERDSAPRRAVMPIDGLVAAELERIYALQSELELANAELTKRGHDSTPRRLTRTSEAAAHEYTAHVFECHRCQDGYACSSGQELSHRYHETTGSTGAGS